MYASSTDLRYRPFWVSTGYLLLLILFALALMPIPAAIPVAIGVDKLLHVAAFALLMLWFSGVYPPARYRAIFGGLLVYGMAMELGQMLTPNRFMELADLAADAVGLAAGWGLAVAGLWRWPHWIESVLKRK